MADPPFWSGVATLRACVTESTHVGLTGMADMSGVRFGIFLISIAAWRYDACVRYKCTYIHIHIYIYACVQMYSHIHACIHTYIHTFIHTYTYTLTYVRTHVRTYVRIDARSACSIPV